MMVAPGRSAQPLASIGRRPSWNHAKSGSPDGLASHAILVGSFGAGLAWGWAAGLLSRRPHNGCAKAHAKQHDFASRRWPGKPDLIDHL